jgi:iron complex outermembrane receptor protein
MTVLIISIMTSKTIVQHIRPPRGLHVWGFGDARVQGIEMETKVNKSGNMFLWIIPSKTRRQSWKWHAICCSTLRQFRCKCSLRNINTNLSTFVVDTFQEQVTQERSCLRLTQSFGYWEGFFKTMEVYGTVYNLLDKDYSDPGPISIPEDIPRPGRTFFVGLSYQF